MSARKDSNVDEKTPQAGSSSQTSPVYVFPVLIMERGEGDTLESAYSLSASTNVNRFERNNLQELLLVRCLSCISPLAFTQIGSAITIVALSHTPASFRFSPPLRPLRPRRAWPRPSAISTP